MVFFLLKVMLNRGIRAISFRKKRVKPGTVLIETVLSRDYLYYKLGDYRADLLLLCLTRFQPFHAAEIFHCILNVSYVHSLRGFWNLVKYP